MFNECLLCRSDRVSRSGTAPGRYGTPHQTHEHPELCSGLLAANIAAARERYRSPRSPFRAEGRMAQGRPLALRS